MNPPRFRRVAGGWVQAWERRHLLAWMLDAARRPGPSLVGNHNLHSLALLRDEPAMAAFYRRCDAVFIDGMPVVALGLAQGHRLRRRHRHTVLDWFPELIGGCAALGLRWMHVGSPPGVAELGAQAMADSGAVAALPEHRVLHGFFDPTPGGEDCSRVLSEITDFAPQVLTVGMGMPRQERWLAACLNDLRGVGLVVTVGAVLEYHAGMQAMPPRLAGQLGLEWLWRLASSPNRLAHRYLVEPWTLLPTVARETFHRRGASGPAHR